MLKWFRKNEFGQGLVEYGLILALLSTAVLGSLGEIGDSINSNFDKVDNVETTVKIEEGYIPIANAEDLDSIRDGETKTFGRGSSWEGVYTSGLDKNYIQVASIDLSRSSWEPIDGFTGTYEGSGMTIKNLKIDSDSHESNGLFGSVEGGTIQDVNLVDVSIQGEGAVGGLVGKATQASVLDSVTVSGVVKHKGVNEKNIGGVVGELGDNSKLSNTYASVNVEGREGVGGLVGKLDSGEVVQSYSHGSVIANDKSGGLVGEAGQNSKIEESYANMEISNVGDSTGGLVGSDEGVNVVRSYWDINTSGQRKTAGDKGEGKSTYEMTLARTYDNWDFENIWGIEEGEFYPVFYGDNSRLNEVDVTFVIDEGEEYTLTGITGWTLMDFREGIDPPKPTNDGYTLVGWITDDGESFDMDTVLGDKALRVTPNWVLNDIVTKTFDLSEEKDQDQLRNINIEDLHELDSFDVDKGDIELTNQKGEDLEFKLSDRPYDRKVQTGGEEILADSKVVSAQDSANYDKDGYSGSLSSYLYSGEYIQADTKSVSGQTSSSYNVNGYSGNLSRYLYSGSAADTKYVNGQTSSWYNSGGYSGNLSSYVYSGSYTPADSMFVSGQTSSWYNSYGYSGNLSSYVYSGSYTPSHTKSVVEKPFTVYSNRYYRWDGSKWAFVSAEDPSPSLRKSYNSGGYSGTLSLRWRDGSAGSTSGCPINPTVGTRCTVRAWTSFEYRGDVTRPASDTRVYRYRGTVTRSASDTRVYRYRGDVTRPDSRVYRYRGNVTRPASDTRVYKYRGEVNRPYSDTRIWDYFYKYKVTVNYRPK